MFGVDYILWGQWYISLGKTYYSYRRVMSLLRIQCTIYSCLVIGYDLCRCSDCVRMCCSFFLYRWTNHSKINVKHSVNITSHTYMWECFVYVSKSASIQWTSYRPCTDMNQQVCSQNPKNKAKYSTTWSFSLRSYGKEWIHIIAYEPANLVFHPQFLLNHQFNVVLQPWRQVCEKIDSRKPLNVSNCW